MLSPLNEASLQSIIGRDEMSKTPTYRTDISDGKQPNVLFTSKNPGMKNKYGGKNHNTSQRLVQIIENGK